VTALARKAVRAMPDSIYLRLMFLLKTGRILHLRNPKTYSEKIQWIKLHGALERYSPYVDKYEVRRYVADTIGPEHLVPIIGVWDDFEEIPFDSLPDQFVLKATHGYGYNFICRDKSSLDKVRLSQTTKDWLSKNFYVTDREPQYRYIRPRLIAEAYLQDESGALRDYKFPCFDGVPYLVQVIGDRARGTTESFYDRQWNLLPVQEEGFPNAAYPIERPALLDEMFDVAARLAAGFPFVRVDLYCVDGRIYFGELTFTPCNGFITYTPGSFDRELGRMLDLSGLKA
jgi:TupA-like ATPgrasp